MPGASPGASPAGYGLPAVSALGADICRLLGPGDASVVRPLTGADGGRFLEDSEEFCELARSVALVPLTSILIAPRDGDDEDAVCEVVDAIAYG